MVFLGWVLFRLVELKLVMYSLRFNYSQLLQNSSLLLPSHDLSTPFPKARGLLCHILAQSHFAGRILGRFGSIRCKEIGGLSVLVLHN